MIGFNFKCLHNNHPADGTLGYNCSSCQVLLKIPKIGWLLLACDKCTCHFGIREFQSSKLVIQYQPDTRYAGETVRFVGELNAYLSALSRLRIKRAGIKKIRKLVRDLIHSSEAPNFLDALYRISSGSWRLVEITMEKLSELPKEQVGILLLQVKNPEFWAQAFPR